MKRRFARGYYWGPILGLVLILLTHSAWTGESLSVGIRLNTKKVVGPRKCAECHEFEFKTLQKSAHGRTYLSLERNPKARAMLKRLGGSRRIDKRKDCMACHYTIKAPMKGSVEKKAEIVGGVSCESCHGAADDWFNLHWKGDGPTLEKNLRRSEEKGMIRPKALVSLAERCLSCHHIGNERLVSRGLHPDGSDFELVSWLQGEVRHNFMRSDEFGRNMMTGDGRLKRFYVVGRLLQLEASLRDFARLENRGTVHGRGVGHNILTYYRDLKAIRGQLPLLVKLREILANVDLDKSSAMDISKAANATKGVIKKLLADVKNLDASDLSSAIPKKVRGKVCNFEESE